MESTTASLLLSKQRSLRSQTSGPYLNRNPSNAHKTDSQSSSGSTLADSVTSESNIQSTRRCNLSAMVMVTDYLLSSLFYSTTSTTSFVSHSSRWTHSQPITPSICKFLHRRPHASEAAHSYKHREWIHEAFIRRVVEQLKQQGKMEEEK